MNNLARYFRSIVGITGLACVAIICITLVYGVLSLVSSPQNLARALDVVGLNRAAVAVWNLSVTMQPIDGATDSSSISAWVDDCTSAQTEDNQIGPHGNPGATSLNPGERLKPSPRPENHAEHAILTLNKAISEQRTTLHAAADSAYRFWQITSVITIVLGMFTTILVSLSSTEFGRGDGPLQKLIRILAIVFPALATASAALIAFYSPQAQWGQASRTLASLTQLHGQMAIGVWGLACIKAAGDEKKVMDALNDWSKRYVDIQTLSTANGGSSAGGGNTGDSGQAGGAGGGQNQTKMPPR